MLCGNGPKTQLMAAQHQLTSQERIAIWSFSHVLRLHVLYYSAKCKTVLTCVWLVVPHTCSVEKRSPTALGWWCLWRLSTWPRGMAWGKHSGLPAWMSLQSIDATHSVSQVLSLAFTNKNLSIDMWIYVYIYIYMYIEKICVYIYIHTEEHIFMG